jgi:hypothetical protein
MIKDKLIQKYKNQNKYIDKKKITKNSKKESKKE